MQAPAEASNPDWNRIKSLRPSLARQIRIYPQQYRGERWYVLRDISNGRHMRFNASAWNFLGRLDGEDSVEEIHQRLATLSGEQALDQDEIAVLLAQLYAVDALHSNLPADAQEYFTRMQHAQRVRRQRSFMNPLAVRLPLLDPDRMLNRMLPWVRPLFSFRWLLLWGVLVGFAAILGLTHLNELGTAMDEGILRASNVFSMLLAFVVIKTLHESAHAFAVKIWGGEVHEMGITFLVLAPVPYVDASAAWAFQDRYKRILVGAVGIIAELLIASLALFLWFAVEPGWLQDAAFNVVLIGSVSTLLFNANPLLRFDGYYILQDLVEIPNLYTRSGRYYLYLIQRYGFGMEAARSPVSADGEVAWFLVYGLAAFIYRFVILAVIVLFLADEYLFVGIALGAWAVFMQVFLPLFKGSRFILSSASLAPHRKRAVTMLLVSGLLMAGTLLVPVSLNTTTEGVVWVPDQAQVYSAVDGLVEEVHVQPGQSVRAGDPLITMSSPSLSTRIQVLKARQRELEIKSADQRMRRRVQSEMVREELAVTGEELAVLQDKNERLTLRARVDGTFVVPGSHVLDGRYLKKGQLVAYVINPHQRVVSTVLTQADIGLVRSGVQRVQVRLAERPAAVVDVEILRHTPAGASRLPSRALGVAGGGEIAVRNDEEGGLTATEEVFLLELSLPDDLKLAGVGERAYVRLEHGREPLARQWLRSGQRLLLSHLTL